MKPLSKSETWLPEDNFLQRSFTIAEEYNIGQDLMTVKTFFMYDLKGIDKDGVGIWNPAEYGSIEYDNDFDLTTATN